MFSEWWKRKLKYTTEEFKAHTQAYIQAMLWEAGAKLVYRGLCAMLLCNSAKYKLPHLKYARQGHCGTPRKMPAPSGHPSKYHFSYIADREMINTLEKCS